MGNLIRQRNNFRVQSRCFIRFFWILFVFDLQMNLFSNKTKSISPAVFNHILFEVQMKSGPILNRLHKVVVLRINIRLRDSFAKNRRKS